MSSFNDFGLNDALLRALADANYTTPTPIQAQAIPPVLAGRDLIGIAQTGTGKTAAFALPILNHLAANRKPLVAKTCRVLVLSPTRELSGQIVDSFRTYARHMKIKVELAIGGVPIGRQQRALAGGVDILVATPGRLVDLNKSGSVRLDGVEAFVLDEADRMLDMGFIHAIRALVAKLPKQRQSLFFSATMPPAIAELAGALLTNPTQVAVTPVSSTVERIDQRVIMIDKGGKTALLCDLLKSERVDRALVFCRTKHGADKVVRSLEANGIAANAIHGNKSQPHRERALASFRDGRIRTLVATDIAARGIDVTGISHVFNFELPNEPETYVHRIGRTARAGAEGIAISFCDAEERAYLRDIERTIKKTLPVSGQLTNAGPITRPAQGKPQGHHHPKSDNRQPHWRRGKPGEKKAGGHKQGSHKPGGRGPNAHRGQAGGDRG